MSVMCVCVCVCVMEFFEFIVKKSSRSPIMTGRRTSLNMQYTVRLHYTDQSVNDDEGVNCASFIIRNT